MRAKWHADDHDAFPAQEERRSSWRRAKRGGVVACGVQGPLVDGGGELPGAGSAGMDTPVYRVPQFEQLMMRLHREQLLGSMRRDLSGVT